MDKLSLGTFAASLFALMNPLGALPVFMSYVSKERRGVQRWLAFLLSMSVLALLVLFLTTGTTILRFFGITLDSFRIAGGILLLLIGIHLVMVDSVKSGQDMGIQAKQSDWQEAGSVYRKIVVPLAMPLLVGPGVIANVILYTSEAESRKDTALFAQLLIVCIVMSFLVFVILLLSRWLQRALGEVGLNITTRILGLLVASIGIQFVTTALSNIIIYEIAPKIINP